MRTGTLAILCLLLAWWPIPGGTVSAAESGLKSYGAARRFLAEHTKILELANDAGGRVLVCPEYQGRVMTSSLAGEEGLSFGFVCEDFIRQGKLDPRFNNYGGEERMWLSPEGGPFSLWFRPGVDQTLQNWYTPRDLNEGTWEVVDRAGDTMVRLQKDMQLENAARTEFSVHVTRDVRLLAQQDLRRRFGDPVARSVEDANLKWVGFETVNRVTNRGADWTQAGGLLSIWMLGMLNSSPQTVVVIPFREGDEQELGERVRAGYFGEPGEDRLKVLPGVILFRADARFRAKIGTTRRRAANVLASIDFAKGVLTLIQFSMPDNPAERPYMNNVWGTDVERPYDGDVANSYNDGPNDLGVQLGDFYELESLSPAAELKTGQTLEHRQRTVHLQGDVAALNAIAQAVLGFDLERVAAEMEIR